MRVQWSLRCRQEHTADDAQVNADVIVTPVDVKRWDPSSG
jgi:hypothetical protein